jgi:hypothetical protein
MGPLSAARPFCLIFPPDSKQNNNSHSSRATNQHVANLHDASRQAVGPARCHPDRRPAQWAFAGIQPDVPDKACLHTDSRKVISDEKLTQTRQALEALEKVLVKPKT